VYKKPTINSYRLHNYSLTRVDSAFQKIKDCRNNEGNDIENKNNGRNIFLICAEESCIDGKQTTAITNKKFVPHFIK